jgi:hypothetical protein
LPPDWTPNDAHAALARDLCVDVRLESDCMRDYAASHPSWRHADWDATFRNWLRSAHKRIPTWKLEQLQEQRKLEDREQRLRSQRPIEPDPSTLVPIEIPEELLRSDRDRPRTSRAEQIAELKRMAELEKAGKP